MTMLPKTFKTASKHMNLCQTEVWHSVYNINDASLSEQMTAKPNDTSFCEQMTTNDASPASN